MNRRLILKWLAYAFAAGGALTLLPYLGSALFAQWAQSNTGFQRHYGHVPLSQALLNYLTEHPRRMPNSWKTFVPYLDTVIRQDPWYSSQLIRQEFDLAWDLDLVQAYSPRGCPRTRPLIFLRNPAPDTSLPWCIDSSTNVGRILVDKGLVGKLQLQPGS